MVFQNNMYSENGLTDIDDGQDFELTTESVNLLFEDAIIEAVNHMDDEGRKAFLESEECEALVEAGRMRKNTVVMLSKKDDQSRRSVVAALVMAKQKGDPLWEQLKKNKMKKRMIIQKIMAKYGNKAQRVAKQQQKTWIKERMPANFGKFGGADRISK